MIIEELGTPEELAARILGERNGGQERRTPPAGSPPPRAACERGWPLGLALLLVPLLLITAVVLGVAAVAAAVGIIVGGVAAAAAGLFTMGCGFSVLFSAGLSTTCLLYTSRCV